MSKRRHLDEPDKPIVDKDYKKSATKMGKIQHYINDWSKFNYEEPTTPEELRNANGGLAQATYLLPRNKQDSLFRKAGYIPSIRDYGLVTKAVGKRDIPIYQTVSDDMSRNSLLHIGNRLGEEGDGTHFHHPLVHAGRYPVAFYVDPKTGEPYAKAWDLNDYAGSSTNADKNVSLGIQNVGAKMLDAIGSPVVVTTGYQKLLDIPEDLEELMYKKNRLVPSYLVDLDNEVPNLSTWSLEPVEITAPKRSLKKAGGIYIKPSHRGRFTALKERTGHSATWFKQNGTPAQKKMATFALNAARWKH